MSLLLLACAPATDETACTSWPDAAVPPDGVTEESCGWYALSVGGHLYANVYVTDPDAGCDAVLADGLALNAEPIFSNMSDDAAKWTYDIVATSAGNSLHADVTCSDGTRFEARVDVE